MFNKMIDMAPDLVSWGDMDKRSVAINVHIVGSPLNSLSKDVAGAASGRKVRSECGSENGPEQDSVDETDNFQFLVYTNSAQAAEDSVIRQIESKLDARAKQRIGDRLI